MDLNSKVNVAKERSGERKTGQREVSNLRNKRCFKKKNVGKVACDHGLCPGDSTFSCLLLCGTENSKCPASVSCPFKRSTPLILHSPDL
jgi:hypothetical protein